MIDQPILVSIPDLDKDPLIRNQEKRVCPAGKLNAQTKTKNVIDEALKRGSTTMSKMSEDLKQKLKLTKDIDFMMMKKIGDSVHSDYFHQPESAFIDFTSNLGNYVTNMNALNHMSVNLDSRFIKLMLSNLLKEILKFLADKVNDPATHKRKFVFYSLHDTNISPLIMYLGMVDLDCNLRQVYTHEVIGCEQKPPFASSVIFELARDAAGNPAIFFRYNGQYRDICSGVIPPPFEKVPCSLQALADRLKDAMVKHDSELLEFCGLHMSEHEKNDEKILSNLVIEKTIKKDRRGEGASILFTHWDTSILCVAIFVLTGMMFKYKSESNERLRLLKKVNPNQDN